MYAIFESGGKQYKAEPGTVLRLEKIPGAVGDNVTLDQVLLVADGTEIQLGKPLIEEMAINGRIVQQGRARKIVIFKHKKRKDYLKKQGHRQSFTAVMIEGIGKPQAQPVVEMAEAQVSEAPVEIGRAHV